MIFFVASFESYRNYSKNAGSEVIRLLIKRFSNQFKSKNWGIQDHTFIFVPDLKIEYKEIDSLVIPEACDCVLILNVSPKCKSSLMTIEWRANSQGYVKRDLAGEVCKNKYDKKNETLKSSICLKNIQKGLVNYSIEISDNAGRGISEYLLFKSLKEVGPKSLLINLCDEKFQSLTLSADAVQELIFYLIKTNKH